MSFNPYGEEDEEEDEDKEDSDNGEDIKEKVLSIPGKEKRLGLHDVSLPTRNHMKTLLNLFFDGVGVQQFTRISLLLQNCLTYGTDY